MKVHPNSNSITSHQSQIDKPHALMASTNYFPLNSTNPTLWHNRLGHPSTTVVNQVLNKCNIFLPNPNKIPTTCHSCALGKSHKQPFSKSKTNYFAPLELVESG